MTSMARRLTAQTKRRRTELDQQIGALLQRRRVALGLTQMQVAERLGVSYQQLCKYETGQNRISASRLYELAALLGCSPGNFFPEERVHQSLVE